MKKWQHCLENMNSLQRYKTEQFIRIMEETKPPSEFDMDLYFAIVEKMMVYDDGQLIVNFLDGTDIEFEIE